MLDRNPCPTNLGMLIILRERQRLPYPKTLCALLLSGEPPSGQDSLGCALTPRFTGDGRDEITFGIRTNFKMPITQFYRQNPRRRVQAEVS
jgi:hypothetical protein